MGTQCLGVKLGYAVPWVTNIGPGPTDWELRTPPRKKLPVRTPEMWP